MQARLEKIARRRHHLVKRRLAARRLALGRGGDRHLKPGLVGEPLDGLGERQILGAHDEADHIAMGAAAEAVIEVLFLVDRERRRLFVVERAQPGMFAPLAGELDPPADEGCQPDPGPQFVEKMWRKGHAPSDTRLTGDYARRHTLADGTPPANHSCRAAAGKTRLIQRIGVYPQGGAAARRHRFKPPLPHAPLVIPDFVRDSVFAVGAISPPR